MNNQYKGKNTKCRTCKHVEIFYNQLVVVKETCPNKGYKLYSDKQLCQKCDKWEEKKEKETIEEVKE